jgi:hypothetical protein
MSELAAWTSTLRNDSALASSLGLEQQAATRERWLATWNQVPFGEDFHRRCAERLARSVPLFGGPVRRRRLSKTDSQLVVVVDPEQPDLARLSLSHAMPSLAWAIGGSSLDELTRALARYTASIDTPSSALPKTERIAKFLELDDLTPIERAIDGLELWIDDARWGSAYLEDPWCGLSPDLGMLQLSTIVERAKEQHPGRRPSLGFRTLWSRSVLRIEQHPQGFWVFELRYCPADDEPALIELSGAELGSRLPPDLPMDLAPSLMRDNSVTHESLRVSGAAASNPFVLAHLCAMDPGEATTIAALREAVGNWADDERAEQLESIVAAQGYEALLFELAAATTDPERAARLRSTLSPGASDDDDEESGDVEVAS